MHFAEEVEVLEVKEEESENSALQTVSRSDMKSTAQDYHPKTFFTPSLEFEEFEELAPLPKPYLT